MSSTVFAIRHRELGLVTDFGSYCKFCSTIEQQLPAMFTSFTAAEEAAKRLVKLQEVLLKIGTEHPSGEGDLLVFNLNDLEVIEISLNPIKINRLRHLGLVK
jgi:predicted amino acid racemase